MIKLFTLNDLSAFASDTVFKICLKLEKYGFNDEEAKTFESYDAILNQVLDSMQNGENIVVAIDNNDYNQVKKDLIAKLILQETSAPEIVECIAINAGDDVAEIDMASQSTVPVNSTLHMAVDGLYTGFTLNILEGRLTFMPLDFLRIDTMLDSLITDVFEKPEVEPEAQADPDQDGVKTYDFSPSVSKMVYSLSQLDKTLSLATGEAVMWVYGLYQKILGLTEVVNFVEVVDEEPDPDVEIEPESESSLIIRHAREAMYNMDTDFGGCISDVYALDDEEGNTEYFALVAVCDRVSARVKKIKTTNVDDLGILLSHCIVMLSETICQKADAISLSLSKIYEPEEEPVTSDIDEGDVDIKDLPRNKLYMGIAVLVFLLLVPIIATLTFAMKEPAPPTMPQTTPTQITLPQTQPTIPTTATTQPTIPTTETPTTLPSATEVVASTTAKAPVSSTSGTFTFYVFGYGHGVGMSQVGANYYANQGWNYAQILALYYSASTSDNQTILVSGDEYPEKIKYAGVEYNTRDYLATALESEMGSSYHKEALKAQAVAIYTFAKYYDYNVTKTGHAYGKAPSQTAYDVVDDVINSGLYIEYNNAVALTPFHAMSAGKTTSFNNAWGDDYVPYLAGGKESYGDTIASGFKSTYQISSEDLKKQVIESLGVELTGDPSSWLTILTHDTSVSNDIGYISSMQVGNKVISGYDFRLDVLDAKIRSHCFTISYEPDNA